MEYRYSGKSGLQLPLVSLGLWHNFGSVDPYDNARAMLLLAWEQGITHFDIANNYGPEPGSAETTFGRVLREDLAAHRDEMIISSKAGYLMWNGPYGDGGSRKYLMASCNQSLRRTGLDYFDIFYSHRYDPNTPIEETMQALVDIVHAGKALYAGISNYPADKQQECYDYLRAAHVPCVISQYKANMLSKIHCETICLSPRRMVLDLSVSRLWRKGCLPTAICTAYRKVVGPPKRCFSIVRRLPKMSSHALGV